MLSSSVREILLYLPAGVGALFFLNAILEQLGLLKRSSRPPLPPGPKPLPFIGNYLDLPKTNPWLTVDKWFKEHGDMVYYRVFGQGVLVLGSMNRCRDLFDRRSSIYSCRPQLIMVNKLTGWDFALVALPYGNWWRQHRRAFHQYFNSNAVKKYRPVQLRCARSLLLRLLESPDIKFTEHIRGSFAEIIMDVVYAYKVTPVNDPYVEITEKAVVAFHEAVRPGRFLVETFPLLQYVPSWFPGAGFQKLAKQWKDLTMEMIDKPFERVKVEMSLGEAKPSVAASMIQKLRDVQDGDKKEREEVFKNTAAIAFAGGTDTSVSAVTLFILAMAMHPEVQRKAQAEIDAVTGSQRLPDFTDRDSLPYVNAVIKETLRWHNIVPLNTPHLSTEDDIYDGYFIPKGTIIVGGIWTILHDPALFPDPLEFRPNRFIKDGKLDRAVFDPYDAIFGYGRRICPGRYLAEDTVYIMVASILTAFDISPPLDENGNPITLTCEMSDGLVAHPKPFECVFRTRSQMAAQLVREADIAL